MFPLLIDLDGVLRIDGKLAKGAQEFIDEIQKRNIPACLLSNTTKLPVSAIVEFFNLHGISTGQVKLHTALLATHDYVKEKYKSVSLYCEASAEKTFDDIAKNKSPEAVVIGDLGNGWSYEVMNGIFNEVMQGADIVAMQMNKFQKTGGTLSLDAGPFITAVEFATGKKAILIGKPSKIFFTTALRKLGFNDGSNFLMIGDDLVSDIKAAQDAGGKGILILSGKTNLDILSKSNVKPDYIVKNLSQVLKILTSFV